MNKNMMLSVIEEEKPAFTELNALLDWSGNLRDKYYRPVKKAVTLRLDADVLEWFKQHNSRYQTAINAALREYIHTQR